MPIKVYKKNRAARKNSSIVDRSDLTRKAPHKALVHGRKRISGRGSAGKITIRHRGGGAKKLARVVDFGQTKLEVPARIEAIEYDPNRSAFIALMLYKDGERRYVLAWEGAKVGQEVVTKEHAPEKVGNRMQLQHITPGLEVFNVELAPGRGGKLFRAAGSYGILMDTQDEYAQLKMPSGEIRLIPKEAYATLGKVSNPDHRLARIGSAGRSRRMGRRPQVRGKAMNPVDHPHGGGEGAQPIGLKRPKTKWGKPALGVKTRQRNKYSNHLILNRRTSKKRK
ncbi:MAG: 50S ribosomal protein L2 [Candidatus Andersenbacteria bacterium]